MKLTNHFDDFLVSVVNLNQTRIDRLKDHVDAILSTIESFEIYSEILLDSKPQGSWAHKTIIKPASATIGFDADIVVFVNPHNDWEPSDYIENLYKEFKSHGTYTDKVSRKTRCVTIQYANDFSIDIVPCIKRFGSEWILNRSESVEEQTNSKGFIDWFFNKNSYTGNNQLIKVIRLLKYLRDVKKTFSVKSILFTTLIGQLISSGDLDGAEFTDIPTSLRTIVTRLDRYLQSMPYMPEIVNPSLVSESFTRHWDQDKYENFRSCIRRYAEWIEDAYTEAERSKSILKWRKVFGDDFAKSVDLSETSSDTGRSIEDLSHVVGPPWPMNLVGRVNITASLHSSKQGSYLQDYSPGGSPVSPGMWIRFQANHSFSPSLTIRWQVVNTGPVARNAGCLRGGFDGYGNEKWEQATYKGKHWVEFFVVDLKRNVCLARSGYFFVNVE